MKEIVSQFLSKKNIKMRISLRIHAANITETNG